MLFFRQLDWKEFSNQPHIKKLPINEQMQQFNFHLQQMSNLNYYQPKGQSNGTVTPTSLTPALSATTPTPTPTPSPTVTPTPSPTPTVYQWTLYTGGRSAINTCDTSNTDRVQVTAYTFEPTLEVGVTLYSNVERTSSFGMTTFTQDTGEYYAHDGTQITYIGQCSEFDPTPTPTPTPTPSSFTPSGDEYTLIIFLALPPKL